MKVRIKKYPTGLGPYQLVEKLCFWAKSEKDEFGIESKPQWVFDLGDRLAHSKAGALICRASSSWVRFHDSRRIKVQIEPHDTWDMSDTLASIILPMLKQLKETQHGAPRVKLEDVPKELHDKELTQEQKDNGEVDDKHFERWEWVLDEMIWTFEQKCKDEWRSDYITGEHDLQVERIEGTDRIKVIEGPNHTVTTDWDALKAHQKRMTNGFILFGKYFENLWD